MMTIFGWCNNVEILVQQSQIQIWDVDVDSKSLELNNNSQIFRWCYKTISYDKLLEKYKTIWHKIEKLKNIELNALSVCDNRY